MKDPDESLRELFAQQRAATRAQAPCWQALPASVAPPARLFPIWSLAAAAVLILGLSIAMLRPRRAELASLPSLLPPAAATHLLELPSLSMSIGQSPTDFLLPTHPNHHHP